MKGTASIAKGRVEEAAGALSDSDRLRAKGQARQAVGKLKNAIEKEVRHVKSSARKVVNRVRDTEVVLVVSKKR